jgi:hypothetical protein
MDLFNLTSFWRQSDSVTLEYERTKVFFIGFRNLFKFWSLSEINQIKTIQFDRIINALFNHIKKKNFSSFAEI